MPVGLLLRVSNFFSLCPLEEPSLVCLIFSGVTTDMMLHYVQYYKHSLKKIFVFKYKLTIYFFFLKEGKLAQSNTIRQTQIIFFSKMKTLITRSLRIFIETDRKTSIYQHLYLKKKTNICLYILPLVLFRRKFDFLNSLSN